MIHLSSRSLLVALLLLPLTAAADTTPRWIPLSGGAEGSAPVVTVEATDAWVAVSATVPGVLLGQRQVGATTYAVLEVPECGLRGATGHPELPFRTVLVPVPNGPAAGPVSVVTEEVPVLDDAVVVPRAAPQVDCGGEPSVPTPDPEAYGKDRWLPEAAVRLADDVVVRGQRFLVLEVAPVRYNPARRQLLGLRRVEARLALSGPVDQAAEQLKARRAGLLFPTRVELPGGGPVPARANPTGVEYLVIAHDSLAAAVEPLAEWKRLTGLTAEVVPSSAVGTTPAQVKTYLQGRYAADPDLTYVLLVGDHNQIPAEDMGYHVTDLYYSCLDGSDFLADVVIGRLSVQTAADCANVVAKILAYERTPGTGDWHREFLLAAYLQDSDDSNCQADRWFFETGTHVMHYLRDQVGLGISNAATSDHLGCAPYRWRSDSYPHRPAGYAGATVPVADASLITAASTATQAITDAVNAGVTMVQHRDHGDVGGWSDPPFYTSHVNALTNGERTPVVFSTNCLTGKFDAASDCFAEAFVKKYPGGAVGVVAATEISYSGYNDLLAHGTWDAFYDAYDPADGGNLYPRSFRPAEATLYGKYYMYHWQGPGGETQYQCEIFHWHGDPSLDVFTDVPVAPTVTHDPTLPVGSNLLSVSCDADGAMVAVTAGGVLLGRAVVAGGVALVGLDPAPGQPTELDVVVTGHNLVPHEGSVLVIVPEGPWLVHRGHLLDDSVGGNGDGILNPGEAVTLAVTVENVGADLGTGLAGTLASSAPSCSVTDPAAAFPDLAAAAQGQSLADHFAFALAADAPHGQAVPFTLAWVADPSYSGATSFAVPVCAPLEIAGVQVGGVTEQTAVVTWTTNVPATSRVAYGPSAPPATVVESPALTTSHSLRLEGLTQCTAYLLEVGSTSPGCYQATDSNAGHYHRFTTGAGTPLATASTDTPIAIPDSTPAGISSTVTVDSPWPVTDVDVLLNITHTYDGDLDISLVGPGGAAVDLSSDNGGSGENFVATVFDDEAATPITSGSAPFTGSYRPEQPLSVFDGGPAAGSWTLKVVDDAGADVGTLDSWELRLLVAEPCEGVFADGFEGGDCGAWSVEAP